MKPFAVFLLLWLFSAASRAQAPAEAPGSWPEMLRVTTNLVASNRYALDDLRREYGRRVLIDYGNPVKGYVNDLVSENRGLWIDFHDAARTAAGGFLAQESFPSQAQADRAYRDASAWLTARFGAPSGSETSPSGDVLTREWRGTVSVPGASPVTVEVALDYYTLIKRLDLAVGRSAPASSAAPPVQAEQAESLYVLDGGDSAEECRFVYVTRAPINAYASIGGGPVIRTVLAGRRIEPNDRSEAKTVVRRTGRARAPRSMTVNAYAENRREVRLSLRAGEEVEVLMHTGESYWTIRHGGRLYTGVYMGDDSYLPSDALLLVSDPETEVWVRLTPHEGRPAAWLNTSGPGFGEGSCM